MRRSVRAHSRAFAFALALVASACGGSAFQAGGADAGPDATSESGVPGDGGIIVGPEGGDGGVGHDATTESGGGDGAAQDSGSEGGATDGGSGGDAHTDGGAQDSGAVDSGTEGGACPVNEDCVAAAPSGWSGPIDFFLASNAAPACPTGTAAALTGGTGLNAPASTCSACTCGGVVGCTDPSVVFSENAGCSPSCTTATATTTCSPVTLSCGAGTFYMELSSTPSAASCVASAQNPTPPPYSWSQNAEGCGSGPPTSCGAASVCAPAPVGSFQTCVYQPGDVSCPAGPYSSGQLVYTNVLDARSCSVCTCGVGGSVTCGGGTVQMGSSTCGTGPVFTVPRACTNEGTTGPIHVTEVTPSVPTTTTCAPGGGQPTGGATAIDPVTVCCLP